MKGSAKNNFGYKVLCFLLGVVVIAHASARSHAWDFIDPVPDADTPVAVPKDTIKFPYSDHEQSIPPRQRGNEMNLPDPSNIKKTVEYDPEENKYYFNEKIGDEYIRNPTYLTMEEYLKYKAEQDENNYWQSRLDALTMFNKKPELPQMYREGLFDRIFGGTGIQVRPQGNVDVTIGGNWQNIKNPALTQRQQKYGIFNFDMQMNINLLATVGDKLKLNISNNTKATFDYQNMQKVEYSGKEDEIIKKIEAGNISFPLKSTLLSGRQSLFGIKTQLQFGKLWVTGVLSQQKSKQNSLTIQGGAQTQQFTIKADNYEENKNFLLGQYFRNNYNKTLQNFPVLNSLVTINRLEVWITNRTGAVTGVRNMLAFMDLGEKNPYNTTYATGSSLLGLPANGANGLYTKLQQNQGGRMQSTAIVTMNGLGLQQGQDYEFTTGRKLSASEYTFNPQLGYISINTQPNPDDIIGVAYQYTYNGKVYQVGEFAEDLPPDTTNQKVIYLKLLKGTSARPTLPVWKLMMKNVYALGGYGLSKDNFRLNVLYQDAGGGEKRYLPEGTSAGVPLLTVLNLDRLNAQNDPSPDGVFDFVEGITVNTQQGKIIFPVLEPFGSDLLPAIGPDPILQRKYPYQVLYDSTRTVALQSQQLNRFVMKGSYKSSSSSEISLGGFNIPQGSVSVSAGGQKLVENQDYQIDYGLGKLKILNTGILNSGIPINVQYEDNATFGFQQQNFMGTRLDYIVSPKLTLGGTFMRLSERPFTQKTNVGDDPIKNTNLGLDASYQSEFPALTRALDKLPIYSTTASSFITASGEVAGLFPGHSKVINGVDPGGTIYIDDFEGTSSAYDLKFPVQSWSLASTPTNARGKDGSLLFPEATLDSLAYGYNRGKLAWYTLEPTLIDPITGGVTSSVKNDPDQHYIRLIQQQEIFPQVSYNTLQNAISTFDLSFYPQERGPYNFDAQNIDPLTGRLLNPKQRWGGITRYIDNTDFEQSNVEYIEMWVMDPFINNRAASSGGSLYINLGDISEDILKDHSMAYENGIPYPKDTTQLTRTRWGYVPSFGMQITRSFDNDPAARAIQDVGYDGLNNSEEQYRFGSFLSQLSLKLGPSSTAYLQAYADPANDDYHYFRGDVYDNMNVLQRYKRYNGSQGNSPITDANSTYSTAATTIPESEDINRDNTLNEAENYYQYRIDLTKGMQVGTNFIVNRYDNPSVTLPNGNKEPETWYQFKIPINEFQQKVGNISDFRSIRFMRMYLAGFDDSVTLRFAKLQLGRNTWRKYEYSLLTPGENIPVDNSSTAYNLISVSVEENSKRTPVPYVIPPGVTRQQAAVSNGQTVQQNEQSISLQVCNLKDGDARAVFKSAGVDLRQFENLRLFVHCEAQVGQSALNDGDLQMFLRIGSDFTNNYYEYRRPMKVTLAGSLTQDQIWPTDNEVDLILNDLVTIKTNRNNQNLPTYVPYQETRADGSTIVVVGQPNTGDTKNIMLGVLNPKKDNTRPADDGLPKCAEVWFDELRVSGITESPAYAAAGKANIQLADLGSVRLSGTMHTAGYGSIDQKVNQRSQESVYTYDASSNLNLGKLMPKDWGVQLPFYMGYSQNVSNPKYSPYDQDEKMSDILSATSNASKRDSIRKAAQDFTSITSFNIANARFMGDAKKQGKAKKFWSLKNFDFSYSYNKQYKHNSTIQSDIYTTQALGIGYTYAFKAKSFEPFKKLIKSKSKWFSLVKDFNFNIHPSNFTFRNDMNRVMDETQVRAVGDDGAYKIAPTYYKNFVWTRTYNLRWELTRSLSFDYNATNKSRVDEPYGRINTGAKKDSLWDAISKLGRNTQYTQAFNLSYTVPVAKLPLTDWTSLKFTYGSTYNWTAASLLATSLGNTLGNTRQRQVNGELNFSQLYNKNRWLKAVNTVSGPKTDGKGLNNANGIGGKGGGSSNSLLQQNMQGGKKIGNGLMVESGLPKDSTNNTATNKKKKKVKDSTYIAPPIDMTGMTDAQIDSVRKVQIAQEIAREKAAAEKRKQDKIAARLLRKSTLPEISATERIVGKLLTMVKRATINYSENAGTIVPGYLDSTRFLGVTSLNSSVLPYAFGYQPNLAWLGQLGTDGKLSRDTLFNAQFQQTYSQSLSVTAQVEPISDLRIDLSLTRTFSKTHSELYKDTTYGANPDFQHLTPYETGSFTQSYVALNTMFKSSSATSGIFLQFLNNRKIISDRLGNSNPYNNGARDPNDPQYAKGYTAYSQEVLIPSFIAAYSGQSASNVALLDYGSKDQINGNPFKYYFPRPNWRITYNGLSKLPLFKEIFTNLVLSSAYTGSLGMNSFSSSLTYADLLGVGHPSFIDSNSGNYVPFYQVPNITISEQLSPLISVDAAFKNKLTARFEVRKSRIVSLSLIDYQVSETKSMEYVFGLGWRIKGLRLPFAIAGKKKLENDLNIKVDVGLRDDKTSNTYIAQTIDVVSRGQKVLTISPTIDYLVSQSLTLRLFYNRSQTIPYVSSSFPITTTSGGLTLRFMFAQ